MKREDRGQEMGISGRRVCGALAVLLSAALFLFLFNGARGAAGSRNVGILILGDSVMGLTRDQTAVPARLEELLGVQVYNGAFGGTCAARIERGKPLDYTGGVFSLTALVKAAEAGDFGVQQSVRMRASNTEYFAEVADDLEELDFAGVPVFLLQHGINDYTQGVPIDDPESPYDVRTFLGAFRAAARSIRRVNPQARIVFVTPVFTWFVSAGETGETMDWGGGRLDDYVEAEMRLAGELGCEVIDLYHDFFPHAGWEDWELYSKDGMHPNEAGREKIALKIAEYLRAGLDL